MFQMTVSTEGRGPLPRAHSSREAPASAWALPGVANSDPSGYCSMGFSTGCGGDFSSGFTKAHRAEQYTGGNERCLAVVME